MQLLSRAPAAVSTPAARRPGRIPAGRIRHVFVAAAAEGIDAAGGDAAPQPPAHEPSASRHARAARKYNTGPPPAPLSLYPRPSLERLLADDSRSLQEAAQAFAAAAASTPVLYTRVLDAQRARHTEERTRWEDWEDIL